MAQVPGVVDLSAEAQADIPTLKVRVDRGGGRAPRPGDRRRRRGAADGPRRPGGRPDARRADRVPAGRPLRPRPIHDRPRSRSGTRRSRRRTAGRFRCRRSRRFSRTAAPTSSCARTSQRRIVVQSNVAGRDLRSVVNDIQARVGAERHAAAGLSRRVRRAVRERGPGVASAALAVGWA